MSYITRTHITNPTPKHPTPINAQGTKSADAVSIEDLDMLADRSMPLCMRVLHKALRREHKLKHWGRLQYGASRRRRGMV